MNIRNNSIELQLIKPVKGSTNNKGRISLINLAKLINEDLHVPFSDMCCSDLEDRNPLGFPTRIFNDTLQYHDGTEWVDFPTGGSVLTQMSVTSDGNGIKLVNDETSPGNYQVYSTDSVGTRGWNDGIFGSGTTNFLPVHTNSNTVTTSRINQFALGVGGLGVDDLSTGITTTNGYVGVFRNSYAGDGSASATPQVLIDTQSNSATQKHMVRVQAPNMPDGSIIGNLLGKRSSARDMHFFVYRHNTNGSTGNYVEHQFHSVPNIQRIYASGNTTFGSGVTADNGFKVEIGGTSRINQKLTLGTLGGTTGIMDFVGTTSGVVTLQAADAAGTYTLTLPTDDGNSGEVLQTNGSGILSWAPLSSGTTSSTYTPTLTNSTNVSASTAYVTNYYQIGDVVTVAGRVSITPTTGAWTQTIMRMSVPVGTALTVNEEGGGVANAVNIQGNNGNTAGIRARALGGEMEFVWLANDTNAHDFFFTFSYQIVLP